MQTLEINTAQNVKIDYELAGLSFRIFAFLIDFLIMCAGILILIASIEMLFIGVQKFVIEAVAFMVLSFYTLVMEIIFRGQSIGKKAMGIKIIKVNGSELQFYDVFCRWSSRLIEIYLSLGGLACIFISSNKNGQRIGDILAGTCVVKTQNTFQFNLKDIENLNQKFSENPSAQNPLLTRLSEKDVLLIKNLLHRLKVYNNQSHQIALEKMVVKVAEILEIPELPKEKEKFLNQVISDYIMQTR